MEPKSPAKLLPSPALHGAMHGKCGGIRNTGITRFHAYLPPDKPKSEQFKVGLSLRDWQWKLTGIGLPEHLRVQLAQERVRRKNEVD